MDRPDSKWLYITQFLGLQTKADPTKIALGAHAQGQNTIINDGDRISVRNLGYELFLKPTRLIHRVFPPLACTSSVYATDRTFSCVPA